MTCPNRLRITGKANYLAARTTIRKVRLAGTARAAGALSVPVLVLTGLANRFDLMPFHAVLPALLTGILLAIGALVMSIFALRTIWRTGGLGAGSAVAGIIYALPALVLAGVAIFAVAAYPRVADVTTDADDPPQFRVLRADSEFANEAGRGGGPPVEISGIAARLYPVGIETVYATTAGIVASRGWSVALKSAPAGQGGGARFEASAKTLLFAFRDDIAIRLIGTPDGTRVDMRSASRWGRHDLGQNGRRIRAFMGDLDFALQGLFTEIEEPPGETGEETGDETAGETAGEPAGETGEETTVVPVEELAADPASPLAQ